MSYSNLLKHRDEEIDGVKGWMWVGPDDGAWDGPTKDWLDTYRDGYLQYLKQRKVVVQAGGNCGLYPRLFSDLFETVYTFEPDQLNFHCLVNNCQKDNIIKINAALGANNDLISINRGRMDNCGAYRVEYNEDSIIPQFTIDQLNLRACDLIQLDVEGQEYDVVKGGLKTIENNLKPYMVVGGGGGGGDPQ